MSNQEELTDMQTVVEEQAAEQEPPELNDEARVALALYLNVMQGGGKVTKDGTKVPPLNTNKISRIAEVNVKQVSKCFDKLRTKGFLNNDEAGELFIPDIWAFEEWLKTEGAVIE